MTGFTLDFKDTFQGGVADGTYEVVVFAVKEDANVNTGTEFINVDMIIRNDIQQPYQNAHIFNRIWKSKETGKYNFKTFNTIGEALQLKEGKQYNNLEELLSDFEMKTCTVKVKNETSEYNGKTYENLNVKSFSKTKFPQCQHQFKTNTKTKSTQTNTFEIGDDDLPF